MYLYFVKNDPQPEFVGWVRGCVGVSIHYTYHHRLHSATTSITHHELISVNAIASYKRDLVLLKIIPTYLDVLVETCCFLLVELRYYGRWLCLLCCHGYCSMVV